MDHPGDATSATPSMSTPSTGDGQARQFRFWRWRGCRLQHVIAGRNVSHRERPIGRDRRCAGAAAHVADLPCSDRRTREAGRASRAPCLKWWPCAPGSARSPCWPLPDRDPAVIRRPPRRWWCRGNTSARTSSSRRRRHPYRPLLTARGRHHIGAWHESKNPILAGIVGRRESASAGLPPIDGGRLSTSIASRSRGRSRSARRPRR